jgi:hypothetical protein
MFNLLLFQGLAGKPEAWKELLFLVKGKSFYGQALYLARNNPNALKVGRKTKREKRQFRFS